MRVYIDPATMERRTEDRMPKGTASSFNWGRAEWLAMGWREIRHVAALPEGRRVTGYRVDVDTGEYCDLAVVSSVSIAEEEAAAEAERTAAEKARIQTEIEAAMRAKLAKLDNFHAYGLDLLRFSLKLRNLNMPVQNQVTLEEAK